MNDISSLPSAVTTTSQPARYTNLSSRQSGEATISARLSRCAYCGEEWQLRLELTANSVPHITNAIQDWIERVAKIPVDDSGAEPDVCVIELGRSDPTIFWTTVHMEKVAPWEISRAVLSSMP